MFLMVSLDQVIKVIIKLSFMNCDKALIWEFLRLKPVRNTELSWINSSLSLGIGFIPHIIINIAGVAAIYYFYKFYLSKNMETFSSFMLYALIFSGAACSLIDKIFWGGSLDYIRYTGILGGYTFDLKDVYITSFEIMLVAAVVLSFAGNKTCLKSLNSVKLKDISAFIINDIKRLYQRMRL